MMSISHPFRAIIIGLLITAGALAWSLVMPGVVAHYGKVFYNEDMKQKLQNSQDKDLAQAKGDYARFEAEQRRRRKQLAILDSMLDQLLDSPNWQASTANIQRVLKIRSQISEEMRSAASPISLLPFHLSPQLLLWPAIYTCLGWLVILFKPITYRSRRELRQLALHVVPLGTLIYVIYEWPLWMRNFVLTNEGRTVYAYPNYDFDKGSFFAQEAIVLGFCLLLASLWTQWAAFFQKRQAEIESDAAEPYRIALDQGRIDELSRLFVYWQVCSIVLSLGFIFFTNFFWTLVAKYNDQRYLLSAIMAHALWGVSWVLISLPLLATWKHWSRARSQAFAIIAKDKKITPDEQTVLKQLLSEIHPLSGIGISLSSVSALVSFTLPIVKLFIT